MYNKWVWQGSKKVLSFIYLLFFIWDAPCMNWTFASRVGDLRSYSIIYSTYNKIELSSKLVRNYAIIQPTIPYDKFSMSNWPSMRGAHMDVFNEVNQEREFLRCKGSWMYTYYTSDLYLYFPLTVKIKSIHILCSQEICRSSPWWLRYHSSQRHFAHNNPFSS